MFMNLTAARLLLILACLSCCSKVEGQSLPHERYELKNGLTVILHEDHSLPIASINLWYRVGARNEPAGRSGFAHLFEHLMFMGTRRVPGSDFDNLMEAGGGANNASTSLDRTNYYSWGPASLLPTLLWLDADRMEELGARMTTEKLRIQQDVVRNEIRQNVENRPYARAYEESYQLLYPETHPYHKGVYGTHEHLEAATASDVKDFFGSFYVPDNCSLVVAGDFDPKVIKPLVEKLFADIPRGLPAQPRTLPAVALDQEVRSTMFDRVQLPQVNLAFHSPASFAAGDAEASILASILTSGVSSRLYQRLVVKDKTAVSVSAYQDGAFLGSLFRIQATLRAGVDVAKVEASLNEELERLVKDGPTSSEVGLAAISIESGMLSRMQSLRSRADRLNEYFYAYGEPDSLQRHLERYRKATPASVGRVAGEIFAQEGRLVQWVLAQEKEPAASGRDERPKLLEQAEFSPPAPKSFVLSNGIPVDVWPKPGCGLVSTRVVLHPGPRGSQPPMPKAPQGGRVVGPEGMVDELKTKGLASLTADMTQEGAGQLDAAGFASLTLGLGGRISSRADQTSIVHASQFLARNFSPGVSLLADSMQRPLFKPESFEKVKRLRMDDIRQRADRAQSVASQVGRRWLFGDKNPYAWSTEGAVDTIKPLRFVDVTAMFEALYRPEFARIFVAGEVTVEEARETLEAQFGQWAMESSVDRSPCDLSITEPNGLRFLVVDRPGAVQTVLYLALPGLSHGNPRRLPLELVNTILGGSFTSRLNRNLREVHGFTYGASARHAAYRSLGIMVAQSAVRADATGPALKEFLGELKRISSGDITEEEAGKARETIRNEITESFGTLAGITSTAEDLALKGVTLSDLSKDLSRLSNFNAAALNNVARDLIRMDKAVLVLVGDRKLIEAQTKDLELPKPIFVDPKGAAISK